VPQAACGPGAAVSRFRPISRRGVPERYERNCVEKLRLIEVPGADSLLLGGGDSVDDGRTAVIQEALFYGFSLERHAPDSHLLRKIDCFVDLSEVRAHLGPYYSDVGRPSIGPELMIRMLIVGYGFGIRSELSGSAEDWLQTTRSPGRTNCVQAIASSLTSVPARTLTPFRRSPPCPGRRRCTWSPGRIERSGVAFRA
jgi:hypothetical protein